VAVRAAAPAGSASDGVHDQVPSAPTVAVQTAVFPLDTVTVSPGVPVPVMTGVVLVSVAPAAGEVIAGACGSTSPRTVWRNALPLLVRLSSTSISHVPAIGFGTWNVAVPFVSSTPFTVRVRGGLPVVVVWVATVVPAGLTRNSDIGLSGLASGVDTVTPRSARPAGTLMLNVLIWPIPRPTVLVIVVSNEPPALGMSVRRAIGSEVVAPLAAVNWTDSGWSPGAVGNATWSGIVAERCAPIVIAGEAGEVIQFWPAARKLTVPR
jgi:hypothetical protein